MTNNAMESSTVLAKAMGELVTASLKRPDRLFLAYSEALSATVATMTGASEVRPEKGDKRFNDPVWSSNPGYKALMQTYLIWSKGMNDWVETLDMDGRNKLRAKLVTSILTDGAAPTNMLVGNPSAMSKTLETGGKNLVSGAKHMIDDILHNGGLPSSVDKSKFRVGKNIAVSEGDVIYRDEILELIQYIPKTDKVFATPIFIIPPQINKFYAWDLAPNRSTVEFLVQHGHTVFLVSWRNPGKEHADWGMDHYIAGLDRASEVACEISKSKELNIVGACSGGITASLLMAYWAATGVKRANTFTLLVAILDVEGAKDTAMGLFANIETLELARMFSRTQGVLPGSALQKAFAWLRPNDLIWAYWVNNYLLGNEPPAFDILFWNSDTTNLPAALHSDMISLMEKGGARRGADLRVLGVPVRLEEVTCDKFLVGGTTDHITPWQGCYQSVSTFGGKNDFVLSEAGHVQSIINPPSNPKARFMVNTGAHATPDEFLAGAEIRQGSWWPYWAEWLKERSGAEIAAPKKPGATKYPPLCAAPGTYVLEGE
ncbi:PHA/PHB synthase family protein [Rubrimonas cliftonensis]|uniref:Polyhydroxyalkanoate synthase n=1 Tax=Rubrimonas cliftonensis TaxID=89524 RepID=A0A1H4FVD3_9RHOB|nr:alpha/beta fold hydrolase [Rubrimonas cliftonensis]SEB00608.1 polyhydroxyalkanoate synthase [Rubrimonas cliftonensis]